MESVPAGGPEGVVDRSPNQWMTEGQYPRRMRVGRAQQVTTQGFVDRGKHVFQAGQRRGDLKRDVGPDDGPRVAQPPGRLRTRVVAVLHKTSEGSGRRQQVVVGTPIRWRELLEQSPGVERISLGSVAQTARFGRTEVFDPESVRQVGEVLLVQAAQS